MKKAITIILLFLSLTVYSQSIDSKYKINILSLDYELVNVSSNDFEYYEFWILKKDVSTGFLYLDDILTFNQRKIDFDIILYPEENIIYFLKVKATYEDYVFTNIYKLKSYLYK